MIFTSHELGGSQIDFEAFINMILGYQNCSLKLHETSNVSVLFLFLFFFLFQVKYGYYVKYCKRFVKSNEFQKSMPNVE